MKVTLFRDDYESISEIVREQLRQLMPDNEFAQTEYLLFGPEFMAQPLRISTPSTRFDFDPVHTGYINILKDEINSSDDSPEEKQLKQQQLESIILFGQILFSQSASLHFLQKSAIDASLEEDNPIAITIERLRSLVQKEGIQFESSKLEALSRRKEFNDELNDLKRTIKDSPLDEENKAQLLDNLSKTKDFYYQANDFNFKFANKPSRSYSNFVNNCERIGSKIALVASLVAIGATALSLIPPFAPVMIPLALAASTISVVIGLPLALKKVGTMLYNLIRFGAAPTTGELITTALLGTSLIMAGVTNVIGQAVNAGVLSKTAQLISQAVAAVSNLGKAAVGIAGQNMSEVHLDKVEFYKSELVRLKPQEQGLALNMHNSEVVDEGEKAEQVEEAGEIEEVNEFNKVEEVEDADSDLDSDAPGMQLG